MKYIYLILIFIIIITIILYYRPDTNPTTTNLATTNLDTDTILKINKAVEEGYIEAFTNITAKLLLFYKPSCKYCNEFMPIWNKIINNLPNGVSFEEINCDIDVKTANSNKINTVPTIILVINDEQNIYMGNRTYNDIKLFLQKNGINLIERNFESFNDTLEENTEKTNPNCPAVSFDKQIDIENDSYMYQIFNSDGQYGYAVGGYNNKLLNPFMAAYSTIDSYLSSIPNQKNLHECAQLYADNIINFGLCDNEQLDNILTYQQQIDTGNYNTRIPSTNYTTNTNIVNSIKKVCGLTL